MTDRNKPYTRGQGLADLLAQRIVLFDGATLHQQLICTHKHFTRRSERLSAKARADPQTGT